MGKSNGRRKKVHPTPTPNPNPNSNNQASTPPPPPPPLPIDNLKRAHELKEAGNSQFQSKDYSAALVTYAAALNLLPPIHPDRAVFHSNRAACLMQLRPVDYDAVASECTLALHSQPQFPRALLRRARAFHSLGRPMLALEDVRVLLKSDPNNSDALLLLHKIQDSVKSAAVPAQQPPPPSQPQQPSPAALGASAVRGAPIAGLGPCLPARPVAKKPNSPSAAPVKVATPVQPKLQGLNSQPVNSTPAGPVVQKDEKRKKDVVVVNGVTKWRPLKLVYGHDIRLAQMPVGCGFRVLREVVGKRFPCSKAVLIKYKDEDEDLVTVTSTGELRLAELSVDKGRKEEEGVGVLRLHVVEVGTEQEPEVVDEEEEVEEKEKAVEEEDEGLVKGDESLTHSSVGEDSAALQGLENEIIKMDSEEAVAKEEDVKKDCDHAECKEVEIDDWLYDFAQLFRQQVGIDPDAHLDLHELGMELCSEALEEVVTSEDAQSLFEMSAAKFQEVAALAFFNWGNVHMCAARKKIPLDESSPKEVLVGQLCVAYDWVRERYALAGEKYEEALRNKPDFYEGLLALGQQHFETAKLHWSFALANKVDLTTWDSSETIKLFDSAQEKMKAATEMWVKVEEKRLNELNNPNPSKKDELKRRKKQGTGADNQGELSPEEAAEQAAIMRSQIHLFWGNMLFERSQVEFKLGFGGWKKNLDTSVERFKLAGASETDISVVLKNHASNASADGSGTEGEEKKVTSVSNGVSHINSTDEDKHVLEN